MSRVRNRTREILSDCYNFIYFWPRLVYFCQTCEFEALQKPLSIGCKMRGVCSKGKSLTFENFWVGRSRHNDSMCSELLTLKFWMKNSNFYFFLNMYIQFKTRKFKNSASQELLKFIKIAIKFAQMRIWQITNVVKIDYLDYNRDIDHAIFFPIDV